MDIIYWKNSGWFVGPCNNEVHAHPAIQVYAANSAFTIEVAGKVLTGNFFVIPPSVKRQVLTEQELIQMSVCRVCTETLRVLPMEKIGLIVKNTTHAFNLQALKDDLSQIQETRQILCDEAHIHTDLFQTIDKRIEQALGIIHHNQDAELSITFLANAVCLSPSHFKNLFKQQVGMSFQTYVQWYRLRWFFQLMHEYKNVNTAIIEAGFSDQAHFSRLFKRYFGWTPMRFLKPDGMADIFEVERMY